MTVDDELRPGGVDAAVHPRTRTNSDLVPYMEKPWSARQFPPPERYYYPAPDGEYDPETLPESGPPATDPAIVSDHVFGSGEVDCAILLPLTSGLLPDADQGTVVCAATNRWLAEVWLEGGNAHGRFRGSIRVNPSDPEGAVREIRRWAGHPHMVQVAVPLEAHMPYGKRVYHAIWEAAAEHGLPVAVHSDGGASASYHSTAAGSPPHYVEYRALAPLNAFYHLTSLIAEGVFDRLPDLRFVFADGGGDVLIPLVWRMDMTWRATRDTTPWVQRTPSAYLADHVRFCWHRFERPSEHDVVDWLDVGDGFLIEMYASNYPIHDRARPSDLGPGLSDQARDRVLGLNARAFYGLSPTPAAAPAAETIG